MSHLDQRKDEAIERTFKQVSREFATIFEKLVPAGHGRLVIQRRAGRRQEAAESDEEAPGTVESYTGVGISVSFNSKELDEQQKIQQLSGGQKSELPLLSPYFPSHHRFTPFYIFPLFPPKEGGGGDDACGISFTNHNQVSARSASSSRSSRRRAARW